IARQGPNSQERRLAGRTGRVARILNPPMGAFDFVSSDTLRQSLEADYNELHRCFDVEAWKAVHVLAGSIVEALLIDYLVSINYTAADPLKMDLAEATAACKQAGAMST